MLYSTNTPSLIPRVPIYEGLDMIIGAGFPLIDFTLYSYYDFVFENNYRETAKNIRRHVENKGVFINQSHAPFCSGERYLTDFVPKFPRIIEFAAMLGAKCIVVHPMHESGYYYRDRERIFDLNMKMYSSLAPIAKDAGIKIGIENMWEYRPVTGVICDSACADPLDMNRYYDTLADSDAVTVCFDIGHAALCGREPEDCIRTIGNRIGALHVHDVDYESDLHTVPGLGKIDFNAVAKALADIKYKGDLTLESDAFLKKFDKELLPSALHFMNDVAKSLCDKVEKYKH